MHDPEISAIREALAANPCPPDLPSRRKRLDGLGAVYPLPTGARIEVANANGIRRPSDREDGDDGSDHAFGFIGDRVASGGAPY